MELLNAKVALSQVLLKPSLHLLYHNWNTATCTADYAIMCVGTSVIRLCSTKSSLPPLYFYVTRDNTVHALSRFSTLQTTESWAGPGNEASDKVVC